MLGYVVCEWRSVVEMCVVGGWYIVHGSFKFYCVHAHGVNRGWS